MLEIQPYRESDQGAVVALWRESGWSGRGTTR